MLAIQNGRGNETDRERRMATQATDAACAYSGALLRDQRDNTAVPVNDEIREASVPGPEKLSPLRRIHRHSQGICCHLWKILQHSDNRYDRGDGNIRTTAAAACRRAITELECCFQKGRSAESGRNVPVLPAFQIPDP